MNIDIASIDMVSEVNMVSKRLSLSPFNTHPSDMCHDMVMCQKRDLTYPYNMRWVLIHDIFSSATQSIFKVKYSATLEWRSPGLFPKTENNTTHVVV